MFGPCQLHRGEVAPMRVSEKRIATWTGPARRSCKRVNPSASATQPVPSVTAQ